MAQRSARWRRIVEASFMTGLCRNGRPEPRLRDAEEARAGPMRTGDPGGDLAERGVAVAIVVEAVFEHDHGMRLAGPFAHQPSAGFEHDAGIEGLDSLRFDLRHQALQSSLRGGREPAMGSL